MVAVDLVPERALLNPNFDGYKLSLDSIPRRTAEIKQGIAVSELQDAQFSLQHVKTFGCHNYLHSDPWNQDCVYVISKSWNVLRLTDNDDKRLGEPEELLQLPKPSSPKALGEKYNVALSFVSESLLAVADGEGSLYLVDTGNRSATSDSQWKIVFQACPLPDGAAFGLRDGAHRRLAEVQFVDVLLPRVRQHVSHGPFVVVLDWVTLTNDGTAAGWQLQRRRSLEGQNLEFAALDRSGTGVCIVSEQPFAFTFDSLSPVVELAAHTEAEEKEDPKNLPPAYTWVQSREDIMVQFTLPGGTRKEDMCVTITPSNITVALLCGTALLEGSLFDTVKTDACTWTLSERRLEIFLTKCDPSNWWSVLVPGDSRGEMVVDAEEAARIHERLMHLTCDTPNPLPSKETDKPYNAQQLEECDTVDGDYCTLTHWHGETHVATHQTNLGGHQWLFSVVVDANKCPAICLRHDVDGLLWDINGASLCEVATNTPQKERRSPWKHTATFNAFGYVVASKQERKFTGCAPDCSYVAVADTVRHIYIYHQPEQLTSELRNRKTGRAVACVAKQRVAALESTDTILGMFAANHKVYVLTCAALHVLLVKQ